MPSGIQQLIRPLLPTTKSLLAGIVPLTDTQSRDGVAKYRRKFYLDVSLVCNEYTIVSRIGISGTGCKPGHVATLQSKTLYLIVHGMVVQVHTGTHTKFGRLTRPIFTGIDSQRSDTCPMRQDNTSVCIHFQHAVAVLDSFRPIDTDMVQMLRSLRRSQVLQNHYRILHVENIKHRPICKRLLTRDDIIHIRSKSYRTTYLTHRLSRIGSCHRNKKSRKHQKCCQQTKDSLLHNHLF